MDSSNLLLAMKKFWRIFWIVLVVGIMVLLVVFLWNKTRPVKVVYDITTPVMDTIRQHVVATGKVEPRDEVLIKPQISGIVSDGFKSLNEGQAVSYEVGTGAKGEQAINVTPVE